MVEERFSELADNHGELIKSSLENFTFKGSPDPSHFIFEINVGQRWIQHVTSLILYDIIFNRF